MAKKYKCPYCQYSNEREKLINHIQNNHEDMISDEYTARRIVFNKVNHREYGVCMVCKGKTKWNESAGKYDKLCDNPKCKAEVRKVYEERMLRVHHTTCMLNDEDHQAKMLAARSISGEYKFASGEKFTYTGSYEKKLLEFEEKILHIDPKDIMMPGPTLEYKYNGESHKWITDQLLIPWNLVIEVKDGGNNPNNRNMESYRDKQVSKELMITDLGTFNYIRLTNNQFEQLLLILAELKAEMIDDSNENRGAIIRINESSNPAANAMPNDTCYVLPYGYRNNVFTGDEIEGFALSTDILSDKIFTIENSKIKSTSITFLKDRKFSIYKYKGSKKFKDFITTESVSDDYFYRATTGSTLACKDLLESCDMIEPVNVNIISDLNESIQATIYHQFREAEEDNDMYFPIRHPNIEFSKKSVIGNNTNLDILKDLDGYFVLNKNLNQRSKSYPAVGEIPKEIVYDIATKDIKEGYNV